jgi:toxin ParE1/3/4
VKPLRVHRLARAELDGAMAFYESACPGLGLDLLATFEHAAQAIRQNPSAWPLHHHSGYRKYLLRRFPYVIFYLELPDDIWIAAVAHSRREPDYWRNRQLEPEDSK